MQVPTDFVQDVMPQGLQVYNSIDRATPENFGGQVGQSLDQAGNMLQQNALQRQQLANETNVNDVYVNQFSPAARDIYQNYMKLEGKDAEARFPEFQQQMNDLRTQVRAGLPNTMQQKAFDEASTRRVEMDLDGMARYAAAQTRAWEWNTHTAVMADLTNEAEANWNNPQRLQNVRDRIEDETADYGLKHGWSSEVFRYQLGENNDKLWSAVIKRQALSGDFTGAMKTYRDQVSAGRISGSAQGDLEKFFKPIQDLQSAQNAYGKVTGGGMAQQIAGEAQRQGVDPGTALTIWSAEGGVTNPATKNPNSSATGIFQHLDSTWADQGGTDQDRFDSNRQIQLGVALAKQNQDALAKDLGRQPQPWEVYLAHQQGLAGATALLHADPNASAAGALGGSTDKLTLNGIPADATAGQALGYIKDYVDKHAQMYEPNGVPSAQNIAGNYSAQLQGVADQAQKDLPGDPGMQQLYMNHYQQQAGLSIRAQQMTDRANNSVVFNALTGPNPVSSWPEFNSDPQRKAAFDALYKTDASIHDKVDKAINVNAWKACDPPATQETNNLYNQLNGMSTTDREAFSKLNLMQYYGAMPVSQFNDLADTQKKIHAGDAAQAAKNIDLQASLSAVKDLAKMAYADPNSPLYQVMPESTSLPDQQKWNGFVSKFGQALEDWRQNNNRKIPTDTQKREIAQGILFPNAAQGSPPPPAVAPPPAADAGNLLPAWATATPAEAAGPPAGISTLRDRDAAPAQTPDSPEAGAIENQPPEDTNTSKDPNADTNVLDSNGKPGLPRVTEVLTFDPVGHLRSSFGHTAININGTTYAFTEKGWYEQTTAQYLHDNRFRNAVGQELDLTPQEQALLVKVIKQDMADNPKWSSQNSCVTKIRDALEQATGRMFGIRPQPPIIGPLDFRDNLERFGYVTKTKLYPRK